MKIFWTVMLTFACIFVGMLVLGVFLPLCFALYPMPEGVTPEKPEEFKAYIATLPPPAFILVLVSHFCGPLAATFLVTRFAPLRTAIPAMLIGALFLFAGVMNLKSVGGPIWFAVTDVALYPLATILGIWLGWRKPPVPVMSANTP